MKSVTYFYRKNGYSIEKVFDTITREVECKGVIIEKVYLPYHKANIFSIVKNIIFSFKKSSEINHVTGDIHYAILGLFKKNTVLTVHDCVMMHRSSGIRKFIFKWLWLKIPIMLADRVTVISNFTKEELIRFSNCNPDKINVVYNPVHPDFVPQLKNVMPPVPRILHFTGAEHKNTTRVLEAIKNLPVQLVIIGFLSEKDKLKIKGSEYPVILLSGLSENEVLNQYYLSDIVLFPSYFEGFGMPIIEGQAIGRPIITSGLNPMLEVAGEGAHFVDPFDTSSIRNGLLKIMEDTTYRNLLVQKGFDNVKRFDAAKIARQYRAIYDTFEI